MQHAPNHFVLDKALWRFDEIACDNPCRAQALEVAGPPRAIVAMFVAAFRQAVSEGAVSFVREHAQDFANKQDWRAVVQFRVGSPVFDAFFNSRSGYRAHFRKQSKCGLAFNNWTIGALRHSIVLNVPEKIPGRKVVGHFQDDGAAEISRDQLLLSIVPYLSKVWWCTARINPDGDMKELWPYLGFSSEPRILVEGAGKWRAPYPTDGAAWVDLKGAFIGQEATYQPKDPVKRAVRLHETGEA
jgi:hypothetical protein